jgi:hypothetical protein
METKIRKIVGGIGLMCSAMSVESDLSVSRETTPLGAVDIGDST